jgi:heme-degrading monooxygenase HmoA
MIMRQWRGRVPREKEQEYLSYLHATGLDEYRSTPGNLGVFATTRPVGKAVEFLLVTFWDSEESIKRFAGDDYAKAVYYPEDEKFLLTRSSAADHFHVKFAAHTFNKPNRADELRLLSPSRPLQRLGQSSSL